ncbi:hypothetical protein PInf_015416 [Phytophthora infestans]|nr:hypothetical protein PInf_015416 [Phytophthora infestans]
MPSTTRQVGGRQVKKTLACCNGTSRPVRRVFELSCCKHQICFRCLSKTCSKAVKNSILPTCWKCDKEIALKQVELALSRSEFASYMAWYRNEASPTATCVSCVVKKKRDEFRVAPCGHNYCQPCLLRIKPQDYAKYQKLVREKDWKVSDLQSDAEYSATVRAMGGKQCPGCGIGVQRDFGCVHMACPNGHQFCYTCLRFWGSCNCPLIPEAELRQILGE